MEEIVEKDKKTILVVDDEQSIMELLVFNLQKEGYNTLEANDGIEAVELALNKKPDLILLDIMLPKMDGFEVCQQIREFSDVPIIMLTAKGDDMDKILGLEYGADDYITKPFNPLEVIARVKAQLRRYAYFGGMEKKEENLSVGSLELDDCGKIITLDGEELPLTPTEYEILKLFIQNPGKVFSSKEIYSAVWESAPLGAEGTIAVHIRHLREKIEIDPANPRYLKVVWGKGYKLEGGK